MVLPQQILREIAVVGRSRSACRERGSCTNCRCVRNHVVNRRNVKARNLSAVVMWVVRKILPASIALVNGIPPRQYCAGKVSVDRRDLPAAQALVENTRVVHPLPADAEGQIVDHLRVELQWEI